MCSVMPSTSSLASSSPQPVPGRKYTASSETSSLESYSSSSDLSTGSENVAVKPVESFDRKMTPDAAPFVSRHYEYSHLATSPSRADAPTEPVRLYDASQTKAISAKTAEYYAQQYPKQTKQQYMAHQHQYPVASNAKSNRAYSRRAVGNKKNRHYSSSMANSSTFYPCSICCYGYPQLVDFREPRARGAHFRNRSYSASQTSVHSADSGHFPTVLSLAECAYLYSNYRKRSSLYNLTSEDSHILTIGRTEFDLHDTRYDVLTFDQVRCLNSVLEQNVMIKSDLHLEVVQFSLMNLILAVRKRLLQKNIVLYDIRLNGGAASHVLSMSSSVYNDIDLLFFVDLKDGDQFERVREAVLEVLLEFIPSTIYEKRRIIEAFVNKMVKVDEVDRWSLISLLNNGGRNVELKFVDSMRRQYEFSVDSFQIVLDTLLQFCSINSGAHPMTINFYPTVVGESMYGNFSEAMVHLHHRLIVTKNPEEIRGGGLLKYCSLLVRNFNPIDEKAAKILEPYMCTRFLIDFIYYDCQRDKMKNYLITHFGDDSMLKYNFMIIFLATIRRSSSLASHHASALVVFENLIMECYSKLLTDYLTLYLSDYNKLHDFFLRCQDMRVCNCPKHLRHCIHRYLNPVYSITSPLVVTYVDDPISDNVGKEERKANLATFIEAHDDLFPVYGGYTFAFLPTALFDCIESNHYVVSSSTLKNIPSARFVPADPPSADYMCTFLMKTAPNGQQPMLQIIPLGVQDLLPKSFHPVEYSANPNVISPGLAYHFFPPIAPPPAYRLCIVNRIPIYYSETIASGPIFNSQIMGMSHYPTPPSPPAGPAGAGETKQSVSLSQFKLSPLYAHVHQHSAHSNGHHGPHHHGPGHHGHHHGGHPHGHHSHNNGYAMYHQHVPYGNGSGRPKKSYHSHHSGHGYFQTQMSAPAGHSDYHTHSPPLEPLRIIYPRPTEQIQQPQEQPVTTQTASPVQKESANKVTEIKVKPMAIPQITINDDLINLNSESEWPAPGEADNPSKSHNKDASVTVAPVNTISARPGTSSYSAAANPNYKTSCKASQSGMVKSNPVIAAE